MTSLYSTSHFRAQLDQVPSSPPPLNTHENHLLDTIIVPPFNQTLRDVALKVARLGDAFEEAGAYLRQDPVRLEAVANVFSQFNGENVNGTEVVVLGEPGSNVNIHTYTRDTDVLLALVDKAEECLATPGPHSFEQHFSRSTAAFGAICVLDGYMSKFSFSLKKGQKGVYNRYLVSLRPSAPATTSTVSPPLISSPATSDQRTPTSPNSSDTTPLTHPPWRSSTQAVTKEQIRDWVFRYKSPPSDDPEWQDSETSSFCVWKVVGSEEADPVRNNPEKFIVAFDWREPSQRKEYLLWDDVCELVRMPSPERYSVR